MESVSGDDMVFNNYKELIQQFGYISMFSGIFPFASFFSYIANEIQIKSQIENLQYQRRFKAQTTDGIGNWQGCLELLCNVSIVSNCCLVAFTYLTYEEHFKEHFGWNYAMFIILAFAAEHFLIGLKLFIESNIDDVPEDAEQMQRDRQYYSQNFNDMKKQSWSPEFFKGIEDAKANLGPARKRPPQPAKPLELR